MCYLNSYFIDSDCRGNLLVLYLIKSKKISVMRYIFGILFLAFTIQLSAQNIVKMSAVKSNDYGVAYTLPKTAIAVEVSYSKKTKKAGEFYQYADRYLNMSNPITKDEVIFSVDKVETTLYGVPNKEHSYLVEFKSNSVAPFVMLTRDGLICAINEEVDKILDEKPLKSLSVESVVNKPNPKSFLSEEILRAGSTAKQAEMIAKQIYLLRETRNNILTGEADNMPPDGNAYKIVMEQIETQEKALTSLFIGTEENEVYSREFTVMPDDQNIDRKVIFRFSSKLGIVESNNMAGEPVYLTLVNKEPREEVFMTEKDQKALEKKFSSGIIYNIPAKADLTIEYKNKVVEQKVCDIVQYGVQEVLVPKQLESRKQPVRITFYPQLGAIKEIKE